MGKAEEVNLAADPPHPVGCQCSWCHVPASVLENTREHPPAQGEKEQPKDVTDIVTQYLKAHGYDGLFNDYMECGCRLGDLHPCDAGPPGECEPGHLVPCDPETCVADGSEWHIGERKP